MRRFVLGFVTLVVIAAVPSPSSPSAAEPTVPTISVDAEGKVLAKPDLATLHLEVETQAAQAEAAAAENARLADNLLKALKKTVAADDKVQSLSYRLTPRHSYKDKSRPGEIVGYQAIHRFQAQIRDLGRLGVVIDTAFKNGATRINGPFWGHSRLEELQREATVNALGKAQRLAQALAQTAGVKIKCLQRLSTVSRFPPLRAAGEAQMAAKEAVPTPIEVGEEEIRAHIQAVFELTP